MPFQGRGLGKTRFSARKAWFPQELISVSLKLLALRHIYYTIDGGEKPVNSGLNQGVFKIFLFHLWILLSWSLGGHNSHYTKSRPLDGNLCDNSFYN